MCFVPSNDQPPLTVDQTISVMPESNEVWSGLSKQWNVVGIPQRPSQEDVALLFAQIEATQGVNSTNWSSQSACILGVTPELVQGPWPGSITIVAAERSADVIERLWLPHPKNESRVQQAEWHRLPVESGCHQIVIGDGCTTQFPDLRYYESFFKEMHRVLDTSGALIMRCFVRAEDSDGELDIISRAFSGGIKHFGSLKWQIAMSITNSQTIAVPVAQIASTFDHFFPDRERLATAAGWQLATVNSIDAYRGSSSIYTFPSLRELGQLCQPYFSITSSHYSSHELAANCPILVFQRSLKNVVDAR